MNESATPKKTESRLIPAIVGAARSFLDKHPAHAVAVILGVPLIFSITLAVLAIGAPEFTRDVAKQMKTSTSAMQESSENIRDAVDEVKQSIDELGQSIDANTAQINALWREVDRSRSARDETDTDTGEE